MEADVNVDREAQMLRAAQLYYYDNLTQGAIADRLHSLDRRASA